MFAKIASAAVSNNKISKHSINRIQYKRKL